MAYKQYSPTKVSVIIGVITARAFADGSMIMVEYSTDKRTKHIGTDGQGRHILGLDRSGNVTIRLADYSPTNDLIMALDAADVPFPITCTDKTSTAGLFFADSCTLVKSPNFERGKEATENEYVFQFINGKVNHSGAAEV